MSSGQARKAVIPAAGLGTRFLPATKAVPKELLPVVDTPAIQLVVAEAARAGLTDVVMVTGRGKSALEDHFDAAPELERSLAAKGDDARLALVRASTELATIHFVRQQQPRGLGHAVLCAQHHVGDEPFAVLLGDDLIDERDHLLERMLAVQAARGGSVVALMQVPHESIRLYGCAAVAATDEPDVFELSGLVEKPDPDAAPSDYSIIGRYVLSPRVFEALGRTPPGRGDEIQLTDALQAMVGAEPMHGVVFSGRRYDTGDRLDYLKTVVRLGSERADLGPDFRAWLREFAGGLA
jgi:UTP--glucose-1-phosphate uridylyltransferase